MGLDSTIYARKCLYNTDRDALRELLLTLLPSSMRLDNMYYGSDICIPVCSWRKYDFLHRWFVNNVQGGEDDCRRYQVSHYELLSLYNECQRLVNQRNSQAAMASDLSLDCGGDAGLYDDEYWDTLQGIVDDLKPLVMDLIPAGFSFEYVGSH